MTVLVALVAYPWVVSDFFTLQIGAYSLVLGTIALSLMVLAGYGGMVSLAQLTVAGIAGYMTAILGSNSIGTGLNWPLWCVIPAAITVGAVIGMLIGALALRTEGIYTIMITLAVAVAFFYLCAKTILFSTDSAALRKLRRRRSWAYTGAIQSRFTILLLCWPHSGISRSIMSRVPLLVCLCRRFATIPGEWRRWGFM